MSNNAPVAPSPPPDGNVARAYTVAAPTIVTVVVATILTGLRLLVRLKLLRRLEWDDFFNVLAMLAVLVVMGLVLGATSNGLGRHLYYVEHAKAVFSIELLRICEFFLILSTVFLKISISLFLKRLFLTSKGWKIFLWCFIAFNTITSLLDAAIIFPQCKPVQLNWDHALKGHCWSNEAINATGMAQGVIAAATDFILATLPIIFLWNIKIKKTIKFGICGLMALGYASGAFAIARTVLVPSLTITKDPTWDLVDLFLWAVLEATFGVIAAAAPSVRPLFGHNSGSTTYIAGSRDFRQKANSSHRTWYSGGDAELGDLQGLKDSATGLGANDQISEEGNSNADTSQDKLWAGYLGRIVKTTDVDVSVGQPDGEIVPSGTETTVVHGDAQLPVRNSADIAGSVKGVAL